MLAADVVFLRCLLLLLIDMRYSVCSYADKRYACHTPRRRYVIYFTISLLLVPLI